MLVVKGLTNTFLTSERENLYTAAKSGQNIWSQSVRYREVLLYKAIAGLPWHRLLILNFVQALV